MKFISFWMLLLLSTAVNSQKRRQLQLTNKYVLNRIECKIDKGICKNLYCNSTILDDYSLNMTITFEFKKPVSRIMVTVKNYVWSGKKYIVSSGMGPSLDFCLLSLGASNPLVEFALPGFREMMGSAMHECPYSGIFSVTNFRVAVQDMSYRPVGEKYLAEIIFTRGKFAPLFSLLVYEEAKLIL